MGRVFRLALCVVGCLPVLVMAVDYRDYIGHTALKARLGAATPNGGPITVAHIEAPESPGSYAPDPADSQLAGKTLTEKSGASGNSFHALMVAWYYYGLTSSIAPGISTIDVFEANDWLGSGFIRANSNNPPLAETRRTQSHSWIGNTGNLASNADMLRRLDLVIQQDGVVVAAGVNNGAGTAMPVLLGSGYNVLAVGLGNGDSSYGPTTPSVEGDGRIKPNLVVPVDAYLNKTSWATPVVAASGALLLQTEDSLNVLSGLPAAQRPPARGLLARTLLMGGCAKTHLSAVWRKGFASPSTDGTVPLDYRFGAGALNIDNSHRILTAGEQNASNSTDVGVTGWDYAAIGAAGQNRYFLQVPPFKFVKTAGALVHWNRKIATGAGNPLVLTPSLANINLGLYAASGFTPGAPIEVSVSAIDNVEHVFQRNLPPGRYVLEVTSNAAWEYVVTWDLPLTSTVPPDFDGDAFVDGDDLVHFRACAAGPKLAPPAGCTNADLDGDGDVDQIDFGLFQRCVSGPAVADPACWQ